MNCTVENTHGRTISPTKETKRKKKERKERKRKKEKREHFDVAAAINCFQ
jgi:hypothetical protein